MDWSQIIEVIAVALATLVAGGITWGVAKVAGFLKVKQDSELAAIMDRGARAAVVYGLSKVQKMATEDMTDDEIEENIVYQATDYMIDQLSETAVKLNMDVDAVKNLVKSRAAEHLENTGVDA